MLRIFAPVSDSPALAGWQARWAAGREAQPRTQRRDGAALAIIVRATNLKCADHWVGWARLSAFCLCALGRGGREVERCSPSDVPVAETLAQEKYTVELDGEFGPSKLEVR